MKRIIFWINAELHKKIKMHCVNSGISMAEYFIKMVEKDFSDRGDA